MKRVVVGITGPSNSGKTTLIEKLIEIARREGVKVAVVKHDPKDKAELDTPGKDSWKFFHRGADVAVLSPTRTTLFYHHPFPIEELLRQFDHHQLVLVEGLRTLPLRRLGVFRGRVEEEYLPLVEGVAVDQTIPPSQLQQLRARGIPVLDLNSPEQVWEWIWNPDTADQSGIE